MIPHFESLLSWLELEDHAIEGQFLCSLFGDELHASRELHNDDDGYENLHVS